MEIFMVVGLEEEKWGGEQVWILGLFSNKTAAQAAIDKAPTIFERHAITWSIETWVVDKVEESLTGKGRFIGGCFC